MSFLRHTVGKSIGNFFHVVFNIKVMIALILSFLIEWGLENKELDFSKGIILALIAGIISIWILQKMVEIIREVDGKKYNSNLLVTNFLRIIWNSILVVIVIAIILLITVTIAGSAILTNGTLGVIIYGVGALVYLWYTTKIIFFPYCIVADGLDNPISISLGITENKFFKIFILNMICQGVIYYESTMFKGVDNSVLLTTKVIIISLTGLFVMILYYNGYERLKDFQYAK